MNKEYCYILRKREHVRLNEIYKIGRTQQKPTKRMAAYDPDSELYIMMRVDNSIDTEKRLII